MTIDGNGKLFGRLMQKLLVETLSGDRSNIDEGDASRWVGDDMFHEEIGGSWGMERKIILLQR